MSVPPTAPIATPKNGSASLRPNYPLRHQNSRRVRPLSASVVGAGVVVADRRLVVPPDSAAPRNRCRRSGRIRRGRRAGRRPGRHRLVGAGHRQCRGPARHRVAANGVPGRRDDRGRDRHHTQPGSSGRRCSGEMAGPARLASPHSHTGIRRSRQRAQRASRQTRDAARRQYRCGCPSRRTLPADAAPTASAVNSSMRWFVSATMFYAGFASPGHRVGAATHCGRQRSGLSVYQSRSRRPCASGTLPVKIMIESISGHSPPMPQVNQVTAICAIPIPV